MDRFFKTRPQRYVGFKKIWTSVNLTQIRSSAVDLAYKVHSSNLTPKSEPIFVLHGLLGSKRNWQSISQRIAAATNRAVIAVDARNHGDSPHSDSHTYLDQASDVSKLMKTLSFEKGTFIGHSMGGRTAMVLALNEPSIVTNMIVVDISPVTTDSSLKTFIPKVLDVMKSVNFEGIDNLTTARDIVKRKMTEAGLFENLESMHFILMNIGQFADKTCRWKCNIDVLRRNWSYVASFPDMSGKQYSGPTLFIGGNLSNFIPPDDIIAIRQLFPTARLEYIEGVGHNVHAENPIAFFDYVMQFLSDSTNNTTQK